MSKQAKGMENFEMSQSQTNTESESDIPKISVSCSLPQSGFSSQVYTVDDIKSFLKVTKKCN